MKAEFIHLFILKDSASGEEFGVQSGFMTDRRVETPSLPNWLNIVPMFSRNIGGPHHLVFILATGTIIESSHILFSAARK